MLLFSATHIAGKLIDPNFPMNDSSWISKNLSQISSITAVTVYLPDRLNNFVTIYLPTDIRDSQVKSSK